MHHWQWHSWQGQTYLTCELLDPWPHGFFTRSFWPQPPEQLGALLDPQAAVCRVKQVHGNGVVLAPESAVAAAPYPEADGIVTSTTGQGVWVCSADCSPVLLADRRSGYTAAVHAGWRGTAQRVVAEAVKQLQRRGSRLADLRVAIGPAIAGEVYQVSTQVAAQVGETLVSRCYEDPAELITHLQEQPQSVVQPDPEPGRVRLDVRRVNALQLQQLGLDLEQVAIAPHCTYQEPDRFFSYRRTGEKKVQWSGIVSR